MLITRIELENIKSYRHIVVDFRRGTTSISGPNGAGKTTLVEAIGFALFDHISYNQAQFVREGEKYGHVIIHSIGAAYRPYACETRYLEEWRTGLKNARQDDQQKKEQNVLGTQRLAVCKDRSEILKRQREHLSRCQTRLHQSSTIHNTSQELLRSSQKQLDDAHASQQAVEDSQADYERYLQAADSLKRLRQVERQRNALRQQQSNLHTTLATHQANIRNLQDRLNDVTKARQHLLELLPLVEQQ